MIFKKISFSSQLFQQRSCLQWVYDFFLSEDDFFFFSQLVLLLFFHLFLCGFHTFILVFLGSLEKAVAPHSSTLAWKIPWTEEPGRLQSMGSRRVGHDWATSLPFRPSMCALSVSLITHYLSFCSSSGIGVAISKAFLWDLPDSIIKWIHGGVFVKMDPVFCFCFCFALPKDTHSVFKNQARQKKNNLSASL